MGVVIKINLEQKRKIAVEKSRRAEEWVEEHRRNVEERKKGVVENRREAEERKRGVGEKTKGGVEGKIVHIWLKGENPN